MQETTAAFGAALATRGVQPVWLVELASVAELFASLAVTFGGSYLAGHGLIAGAGILAGATRGAYTPLLAGDGRGVGAISVELDPQSAAVRVGAVTVELLNQENYAQRLYTSAHWDNGIVRVLLGFQTLAYSDYLPVFWGVVDNNTITWDGLTLDVIDDTLRQHKDLSIPLSSQEFPNTPRDTRGRAIPILIGRNTDVEALPISGAARGSIAVAVTTSDTTVLLKEFDAPFPASGTISLGTETGVTYTASATETREGITYLALSGLTRGSPASQAVNLAVVLTSLTYNYLVGYEVGEVTAVRDGDTLLSTADYTVTLQDDGADRLVTTVLLDAEPDGAISVDADGLNILYDAGLTNGGFEAGSATGWTSGSGMSASVTTGSTHAGTYKVELTGAEDVAKDFYQDFTTVPGRFYTLEFYYLDTIDGSNELSNGSFETGSLDDWDQNQLGAGVSVATAVSGGAQDGSKRCMMTQSTPTVGTFLHEIVQEFTTSIGADYSVTFSSLGERWFAREGIYIYWYHKVGYALGTPDNPGLYGSALEGAYDYRGHWRAHGPYTFTATTTTTRLAIRGAAYSLGFPYGFPRPLYLDAAVCVQTTNLPTSTSSYQLGTSGDADAYASATLEHSYGWTRVEVVFQALSNSTRLTLQSQWTDTSTPSHYDSVRLLDAGRNPAEAIAYIMDTYLPDMRRDVPSFDTAYQQLAGWQYGCYLPDPGESKALLERMAAQCKSRLITNAAGKTKMVVFDTDATTALTLTTAHILEDSLQIAREPLDNLYSEFYVYYGLRSGAAPTSAESYQGLVSATPDATTHTTLALHINCQQARLTLRRARRWNVMADMIRDADTAHRLLEYLVPRHTLRQDLVTLRTTYRAVALEVSDLVLVIHPLLQAEDPTVCEVLGVTIQPGDADIALTLRTLRFGGISEDWDCGPAEYIEYTVVTEAWES